MSKVALILALVFPAFVAAQQPGSAGAKRPKLEVLKSLPEAQLFPLMNLVATSLGVRCDYCHVQANPDLSKTPSNLGGWVWDRDDKLPKRRASRRLPPNLPSNLFVLYTLDFTLAPRTRQRPSFPLSGHGEGAGGEASKRSTPQLR